MTRVITALSAALVALTLTTPAATANTYDVYSCWAGYGTYHNPNASTVAWTRDESAGGGHFTAGDSCGLDKGSGALTVVSLGALNAAQGQHAELSFNAPTGATIAGASLWRRAWTYGSGNGASSQRNALSVMADGKPYALDGDGTGDVPLGSRGNGDMTAHGINSANLLTANVGTSSPTTFSYRVGCGFAAGCLSTSASSPYPGNYASGVELFGSIVTIRDTTSPSLMLGTTGLFDGREASALESVDVQLANDASGIKKLAVFADDGLTPVGVLNYEEAVDKCDWSRISPCQNVVDVQIPVDTTQLTDGLHSFVVKAFDAADNERASTTHYVTVKNAAAVDPTPDPTPAPTPNPTPDPVPVDQGTDGLPNGTTGTGENAGAPAVAGSKLVVTFDQNGRSKVQAKYGRIVVVRGTLTDGAGQRITNAQIDYSARSTAPRARVQNLGSVRTDSHGTFALTVTTKVGSRRLSFAYRPQLGGAIAASADAQLDVIPPISLNIAPRHVRNRHAVTFRGGLSAGPIPRKGKLVNLQVIVDGHWHTFATVRTTKSGRFKFRYRFMRTYGFVTYRFRARSRYEAAYPFVAGSSRTVRVAVTSCPIGCD